MQSAAAVNCSVCFVGVAPSHALSGRHGSHGGARGVEAWHHLFQAHRTVSTKLPGREEQSFALLLGARSEERLPPHLRALFRSALVLLQVDVLLHVLLAGGAAADWCWPLVGRLVGRLSDGEVRVDAHELSKEDAAETAGVLPSIDQHVLVVREGRGR